MIYRPERGAEIPSSDEIGGKAHHLARLHALGVDVPTWIVVGVGAFDHFVLGGEGGVPSPEAVRALALPASFRSEVLAALEAAGLGKARLAVRSSAAAEDAAAASFAGQFNSVLGVRADGGGAEFWDAIRQVWASAFNAHAVAYHQGTAAVEAKEPPLAPAAAVGSQTRAGRSAIGTAALTLNPEPSTLNPLRMAVILQEMVDAAVSGVAFSVDPVTGERDTAVVSAVYGLGEGLVSGELDADTYRVAFGGGSAGEVRSELARKDRAVHLAPGGRTRIEPVPEDLRDAPTLTDDEARRIAAAARRLADAFGGPQDVEWALVEDGRPERRLVVLQSRPVTRRGCRVSGVGGRVRIGPPRPPTPDTQHPTSERRLWDNSNIVESYGGVTTPLTFSFARGVYEEVYRQFCRVMGVSEALLEQHREVFAQMLGLVRGRVYYNLMNWYRALALLPGYSFNRAFMERMMGVRQKLENPPDPPYVAGRWEDLGRLVRMAGRLLREHRRLPGEVAAFHARIDSALTPLAGADLAARSPDDLAALYRRLEAELLRQWRAPLVNDFFAMIFFGVLGRLTEKWLPDAPPTLANDLLCGEGGIISTEPAHRVMGLARQVAGSPALTSLFASEPDDAAVWEQVRSSPEFAGFHGPVSDYLDRFGDRCMNELKLETVTLGENPAFLLQMVRAYTQADLSDPEAAREREIAIRRDAERLVKDRLRGPRQAIFMAVLRRTRERVRDRENLRFERTRVFGLVRRIFRAIGGHLAASGHLAGARDIFYLTKEEVFGYLDGTGVTTDLRALVMLRRAQFDRYEQEPAPPDRFETFGPPQVESPELRVESKDAPNVHPELSTLRGTGCCPGIVRAPVRVVRDPRQAHGLAGHILVAERTDPGWTLLFPAAKGLLVQRGSLLSHSAIVAREMGLPCVVGVSKLLETLQDGDWVEMDGTTGEVKVTSNA